MVGADSSGLQADSQPKLCQSDGWQPNWQFTHSPNELALYYDDSSTNYGLISIITNSSITDYHFKYALKSIDLLSLVHWSLFVFSMCYYVHGYFCVRMF